MKNYEKKKEFLTILGTLWHFFPKLPLSPKQPYWTTNSFVIEHFNRSDPWSLWTIRQKLQKK